MAKRKRKQGRRLDDPVVADLPFRHKQYTVWDLSVEGCGVRLSGKRKTCVICVRVGDARPFETIGVVTPDSPYEYLREKAIKRIGELKGARLQLVVGTVDPTTLTQAKEMYLQAHPKLMPRTRTDYEKILPRNFKLLLDQPVSLLTRPAILDLNKNHLERLSAADPGHAPPRGYWAWQTALRNLRAIVTWYAELKDRPSPWPSRKVLPLEKPPARTLPIELQTIAGRRRLISGLKADPSPGARACRVLAVTGFRRLEATVRTADELIGGRVLEFRSKTRILRVPLCKQALALIDKNSATTLLEASVHQLRAPLIRIFGERRLPNGRKKACVTPHDLRRLFKTVGKELKIDPTILNILVGHTLKGTDGSYVNNIRLEILYEAVQRIADEIENPTHILGEEEFLLLDTDANEDEILGHKVSPAAVSANQINLAADYLKSTSQVGFVGQSWSCHYLPRRELFKLVWTAPMTEIAARFGISDRGLSKLCTRAGIPTPPRGYWAKVESGSLLMPPELPPAPRGLLEPLRIRGKNAPPQSTAECTVVTSAVSPSERLQDAA